MPKIFRLTKGGKLNEGIFKGETINTPSMLCVEDALDGLRWAESVGGLNGLIARSEANLAAVARLGGAYRLGGFPGRGSGHAVLHLDLPEDRRAVVHVAAGRPAGSGGEAAGGDAGAGGRGLRHRRRTAMRRPASASGAAPRWRPRDVQALLPWLDWAHDAVAQEFAVEKSLPDAVVRPIVMAGADPAIHALWMEPQPNHGRGWPAYRWPWTALKEIPCPKS